MKDLWFLLMLLFVIAASAVYYPLGSGMSTLGLACTVGSVWFAVLWERSV